VFITAFGGAYSLRALDVQISSADAYRVRLRPDSTTATSSRQSRDVSSLSRDCRILNCIAASSSNQTRVKLETSRVRQQLARDVADQLETSPPQAQDSLSRGSRCSGIWPSAASGAGTSGRTPRAPGRYEGAVRGRRKNFLFDRLRVSSIEFLSHVKHVIFLTAFVFCSPLSAYLSPQRIRSENALFCSWRHEN
jgi:hypothetical protein